MSIRIWGLLLILSILWALSFVYNEIALAQLSPAAIVFGRASIGFFCLLPWLKWSGVSMNLLQEARHYLIASSLGFAIPITLVVWGQHFMDIGLSSIFNATIPFFALLIAHFLTHDEKITASRLIGILLGIAGVAVLLGSDGESGQNPLLGGVLIMLSGLIYAFNAVYIKTHMRHIDPRAGAAGMLLFSSLWLFPLALWEQPSWQPLSLKTLLALGGLGLFSSALAFTIYLTLLRMAGAVNTLLVVLLIPLFAVGMGALWFGETVTLHKGVGAFWILLGLLIVDGRLPRR